MQSQEPVSKTERTAYRTPKLVRFGNLASLTAGGTSSTAAEGISSGPITLQ